MGVAAVARAAEPPHASSAPVMMVSPDAGLAAKGEAVKPHAEARRIDPPHGRQCYNAAETRDNIAAHRLTEPFRALRAGGLQGEALRARLCRWKPDEYIYEVSVLRPSGRIAHIYMNARSGQAVGALDDNDHK